MMRSAAVTGVFSRVGARRHVHTGVSRSYGMGSLIAFHLFEDRAVRPKEARKAPGFGRLAFRACSM